MVSAPPKLIPRVDVRRAGDRKHTELEWLSSRHSFSFGRHFDPANIHFGLLLVSNDDVVKPGMGFETHPHRDMEIVTWVLRGSLVHQDSTGNSGLIYPGLAQRMSAGACQRKMRMIWLIFSCDANFLKRRINSRCQLRQFYSAIHARPENARCIRIREKPYAIKPHDKRLGLDRGKRCLYFLHTCISDFADEF